MIGVRIRRGITVKIRRWDREIVVKMTWGQVVAWSVTWCLRRLMCGVRLIWSSPRPTKTSSPNSKSSPSQTYKPKLQSAMQPQGNHMARCRISGPPPNNKSNMSRFLRTHRSFGSRKTRLLSNSQRPKSSNWHCQKVTRTVTINRLKKPFLSKKIPVDNHQHLMISSKTCETSWKLSESLEIVLWWN